MAGPLFTPRAERDLEEIWAYSAEHWSTAQADGYLREIFAVADDLAGGRRKGRPVAVRSGYYKLAVGSHVVYFQLVDDTVLIIRILHQRMDIDRHL